MSASGSFVAALGAALVGGAFTAAIARPKKNAPITSLVFAPDFDQLADGSRPSPSQRVGTSKMNAAVAIPNDIAEDKRPESPSAQPIPSEATAGSGRPPLSHAADAQPSTPVVLTPSADAPALIIEDDQPRSAAPESGAPQKKKMKRENSLQPALSSLPEKRSIFARIGGSLFAGKRKTAPTLEDESIDSFTADEPDEVLDTTYRLKSYDEVAAAAAAAAKSAEDRIEEQTEPTSEPLIEATSAVKTAAVVVDAETARALEPQALRDSQAPPARPDEPSMASDLAAFEQATSRKRETALTDTPPAAAALPPDEMHSRFRVAPMSYASPADEEEDEPLNALGLSRNQREAIAQRTAAEISAEREKTQQIMDETAAESERVAQALAEAQRKREEEMRRSAWACELTGSDEPLSTERRRALLEFYADMPGHDHIIERVIAEDPELSDYARTLLQGDKVA